MREEKALVRLHICTGLSEPSLLADAIGTKISCVPNIVNLDFVTAKLVTYTDHEISHPVRWSIKYLQGLQDTGFPNNLEFQTLMGCSIFTWVYSLYAV